MNDTAIPNPTVSVIIPAYNVASFVGETLESVFVQTFRDYEVILVNDGSPDTNELLRVIAPHRERIRYIEQKNRGLSGARNAGIGAANGEYIALLDGDDIWLPDYLDEQVGYLRRNPSVDLVYCDALFFGDSPYKGKRYMECFPSEGNVDFGAIVSRRCHVFVSVLARRSALEEVGEFDESLKSCEDFDYWLRLTAKGHRIGYQRKVLAHYRKHGASLSANLVRMAEYKLRVLEKASSLVIAESPDATLLKRAYQVKSAELELLRGKSAMLASDVNSAKLHFQRANAEYRSRKLSAVITAMSIAPGLVRRVYEWRQSKFSEYDEGLGA